MISGALRVRSSGVVAFRSVWIYERSNPSDLILIADFDFNGLMLMWGGSPDITPLQNYITKLEITTNYCLTNTNPNLIL